MGFEMDQYGCLLIGFVTYKASTLTWLWKNDIKPSIVDSILESDPKVYIATELISLPRSCIYLVHLFAFDATALVLLNNE
jgi:hypothetical protein